MALTDTTIRTTKPGSKIRKMADGGGLYVQINPNGSRYWRLKYRFDEKQKTLALGIYPDVTLAEARHRRSAAREQLANGIDPGHERRKAKQAQRTASANNFERLAREWVSKQAKRWSKDHAGRVLLSLERDIFPDLGARPITEIDAPELLATLRKIESRGAFETLSKVHQRVSAVFRYGIATGRCERDPAPDLRGAFTTPKTQSHAALMTDDLPEFLHRLAHFDGHLQTRLALRLVMLTFVRTGELRGAHWAEFTLDNESPTWRIPAERMKMRDEHIVPLSRQSVDILRELRPLAGGADLVLPGRKTLTKPISENTLLYAMYRMGYHGRATVHGFRATASTILNEQGYRADMIERQLAHGERNKVRAAYNRAEYLPERRQMMQSWADYLDGMARGANVVPLHAKND